MPETNKHDINIRFRPPSFTDRVLSPIGLVVGLIIAGSIVILVIALGITASWATIKWLIPTAAACTIAFVAGRKAYTAPSENSVPFFQHKATVKALHIILVIFILLSDIQRVP